MKKWLLMGLFLSSSAWADIAVKFSVVDTYSKAPIDWTGGWSTIDLSATGPDGEVVYPQDRESVFVFPKAGVYTFNGRGAYVCGLNGGQKVEITTNIVEIQLFGWCE